jgi:hypothetical protein
VWGEIQLDYILINHFSKPTDVEIKKINILQIKKLGQISSHQVATEREKRKNSLG